MADSGLIGGGAGRGRLGPPGFRPTAPHLFDTASRPGSGRPGRAAIAASRASATTRDVANRAANSAIFVLAGNTATSSGDQGQPTPSKIGGATAPADMFASPIDLGSANVATLSAIIGTVRDRQDRSAPIDEPVIEKYWTAPDATG